MLKRLTDLGPSEWIKETTDRIELDPERWDGNRINLCLPKIFASYAKIFHPIFEDLEVSDRSVSWNDLADHSPSEDPVDNFLHTSVTVYGGQMSDPTNLKRISWQQLAKEQGLTFHAELTTDTFTRNFRGKSWPRYLIGPEEGRLDDSDCHEVVKILSPLSNAIKCFFLYHSITTDDYESDWLFEGRLDDVFLARNVPGVHASPTCWWPEDRKWFVYTDYDLAFTLFAGDIETIDTLVSNPNLECIRVEAGHRIDYRSDTINP